MIARLLAWLTFREPCPCPGCNGLMRHKYHCGRGENYYECPVCGYNTYHKECSP